MPKFQVGDSVQATLSAHPLVKGHVYTVTAVHAHSIAVSPLQSASPFDSSLFTLVERPEPTMLVVNNQPITKTVVDAIGTRLTCADDVQRLQAAFPEFYPPPVTFGDLKIGEFFMRRSSLDVWVKMNTEYGSVLGRKSLTWDRIQPSVGVTPYNVTGRTL